MARKETLVARIAHLLNRIFIVVKNLEMRLHSRRPIVADAVLLDQRQDLTHVLNEMHARSSRRTLRSIPRVDYAKLHQGEM